MVGTYYAVIKDQNTLQHHGVKGMKWGVRRYQNYDGSYTQAGMKRFNASMDKYEKANARYKQAQIDYNKASHDRPKKGLIRRDNSEAAKAGIERTNARMAKKEAKRQLEKDYNHLKEDKRADKGKDLYSRGHTITSHKAVNNALATVGSLSLTAAGAAYDAKTDPRIVNALTAVSALSFGTAIAKGAVDTSRNKNLRAYYSHTSNY